MTPCQTLQTKPVLKMSVSNFGVFSFDFLFVDIIWFQNDFEASVSNSAQFVQTCWNWDINITSLHCIAYIYYNLRAENLVFDQTILTDALTDAYLSSHYVSSRQYIDIVRRNYRLVTPGSERVKRGSVQFLHPEKSPRISSILSCAICLNAL